MISTPRPGRSGGRRAGFRLAPAVAATALLAAGCDARDVYERSLSLGLPDPITEQAKSIYDLWLGSVAAALAVGFFVWGLILFAAIRYRKKSDELPRQVRYNLPIEVLYTVVPFVIIAVLFYYTAVSENFVNKSEEPDVRVDIVGFQWNWQFNYPEDGVRVTGSPRQPATMVLPVDQRIRFYESSPDVIHSWFVPDFLFKRDVVPGRTNAFEVRTTKTGTFLGRCTEFCGEKHARMNFYVRVVSQQEYRAFIDRLKADPAAAITGSSQAIPTQPEYGKIPGFAGDSEGEGSDK